MAIDNQFGKGIGVAAGFDLGAQKPLDARIAVNTIAERDAHVENNRAYEGMIVFVDETKKNYQLINGAWQELAKAEQDRLDALEAMLNGEGEGAEGGALGALQTAIETEANRAKGVEQGLQTAIDTINNAESGILAQAKALDKADRDAQALVDKAQDDRLKALEDANAEGGAVKEAIDKVAQDLADFESEQETAHNALEKAMEDEAARVNQKIADDIAAESALRVAEEARIEGLVTAEATKAREEEGKLSQAIATEQGRAEGKEAELLAAINKEIKDRGAAVLAEQQRAEGQEAAIRGELSAAIAKEVEDRNAAIKVEADRAKAEEADIRADFAQADADLHATIKGEMAAVIQSLVAEITEDGMLRIALGGVQGDDVLVIREQQIPFVTDAEIDEIIAGLDVVEGE